MAKIADLPPAFLLVINCHEGLSHFGYVPDPEAAPAARVAYVTLVPGINSIEWPGKVKTDLSPADFFSGVEIVTSAERLSGMLSSNPNLIDHAQSVPALRLVAAMCPEFKDRCDKRIEFFRSGANPNPDQPRAG